ncbi:MAG: response regulator transcription factor [Tissierellia bacterium]|nr:response regulator transcription factor [Tissierellia bacterium]
MKPKILLVEDEDAIRKFVKINIERAGMDVWEAANGEDGVRLARLHRPDVVVLDVMMPVMDGIEACGILRKEFPEMGIIFLTAKTQDIDKISGLEMGSDDYLTKPFNPTELILRIKSLLRRVNREEKGDNNILEYGPFKIDTYSRRFLKDDMEIELTPTEFAIISIFMKSPGKALTRDEILNLAWGCDFIGDSKIVDVNIRRLRHKIEDDSRNPDYIQTVWGMGYRWGDAK